MFSDNSANRHRSPITILSIEQACQLISAFLALDKIKDDAAYNELLQIPSMLQRINELQTLNSLKDMEGDTIDKNQDLSRQRDERDKLSSTVCQMLNKFMNCERFKDITIDAVAFDSALFTAALTLADLNPANEFSVITGEKIEPSKRIVTSDRHQFDIDELIEWFQHKTTNPFTNKQFDKKDLNYLYNVFKSMNPDKSIDFNSRSLYPGGDPNLEETLLLVREMQDQQYDQTQDAPEGIQTADMTFEQRLELSISVLRILIRQSQLSDAESEAYRDRRPDNLPISLGEYYLLQNEEATQHAPQNPAPTSNRQANLSSDSYATSLMLSQSGIFNRAITSTRLMQQAISELGDSLTIESFNDWPNHNPFTQSHCDVLVQLIRYDGVSPHDALDQVKTLDETQVRELLMPNLQSRTPSPRSGDD